MRVTFKDEEYDPVAECDEFGIHVGNDRIGGLYMYRNEGRTSVFVNHQRQVLHTTDLEAIRAILTLQLQEAA